MDENRNPTFFISKEKKKNIRQLFRGKAPSANTFVDGGFLNFGSH
jgi:hypothetical protein